MFRLEVFFMGLFANHVNTFLRDFICLLGLVILFAPHVEAQESELQSKPAPVNFITVEQGDDEYDADVKLVDHLGINVIRQMERSSYEAVVQKVLESDANLVARMTPYAFVAAEIQGAQLKIIATYKSKSGGTTYQTNFVVQREDFPDVGPNGPSMNDIVNELQRASDEGKPFRFIYHKRLSTSSYFLPSLFFRSERIFSIADGESVLGKSTISIKTEQISPPSSKTLVKEVVATPRTFAAVWDSTRSYFTSKPEAENVYFVKYPFKLPNDLLVATRDVDPKIRQAIHDILETDFAITTDSGKADVAQWVIWNDNEAKDARTALSDLRHAATTQPAPVIVRVTDNTADDHVEEAVKQAIRLSSTELVAWDEAYEKANIEWTLETIHDGALLLTVSYDDFMLDKKKPKQKFRISYLDNEDLTQRIGSLIHSRMHRIRSVWLYQDDTPMIIRDVAFEINDGLTLPYQLIKWSNPERNEFVVQNMDEVKAGKLDFSKFELSRDPFPQRQTNSSSGIKKLNFEPMGRAEYRVLLLRPTEVRMLFKVLTVLLLSLFALGLAGVIWELRRENTRDGAR